MYRCNLFLVTKDDTCNSCDVGYVDCSVAVCIGIVCIEWAWCLAEDVCCDGCDVSNVNNTVSVSVALETCYFVRTEEVNVGDVCRTSSENLLYTYEYLVRAILCTFDACPVTTNIR